MNNSKTKHELVTLDETTITKTFIEIPNSEYFFDILAWIYTKDGFRLSLAADEPESFLGLVSLGIFLEMNDDFFKTLLKNCEIKLDETLFEHYLWSRSSFTFEVLKSLIKLMPEENNFLKIIALFSWLKEDSVNRTEINETIKEKEADLLTSKDYFSVKEYIQKNNLLDNIKINELDLIRKKYPELVNAFDNKFILKKFVLSNKMKITCRVCLKTSNNIQEFLINNCEIKLYHPRNVINYQRKLNHQCEHENCKKKIQINEYPCCHKGPHTDGCLISDGRHILQFETKELK